MWWQGGCTTKKLSAQVIKVRAVWRGNNFYTTSTSIAFRQIDVVKNKLEEEKLYLQEEIRTEYNLKKSSAMATL